jgi:hypothetical protein
MTYRLRQGAEDLGLAHKPQMAAPWRRKMEQGAEASDGCAMAQGNGAWCRCEKKPYKLQPVSEKRVTEFDGERIIFQKRFRGAPEIFQVWKLIPTLIVMNSITLIYVYVIDLIMSN